MSRNKADNKQCGFLCLYQPNRKIILLCHCETTTTKKPACVHRRKLKNECWKVYSADTFNLWTQTLLYQSKQHPLWLLNMHTISGWIPMSVKRVTLFSVLLHIIKENNTQKHLSAALLSGFHCCMCLSSINKESSRKFVTCERKEQTKTKTRKKEKGMVREKQKKL